jgi:hypothetical protein
MEVDFQDRPLFIAVNALLAYILSALALITPQNERVGMSQLESAKSKLPQLFKHGVQM